MPEANAKRGAPKLSRRTALTAATAAGGVAAWGAALQWMSQGKAAEPLLRPPGALAESDFLASCIKCGQCVQVCPYHSLRLLDFLDGAGMGTPWIDAAKRGCYLCDLFPCVLCCPSGALKSDVQQISQVEMGVAVVTEPDACWARSGRKVTARETGRIAAHGGATQLELDLNERLGREHGSVCRLCEAVCAVEDRAAAIRIEAGRPVIGEKCVGCGACAEACPESIIKIVPRKKWSEVHGQGRARKQS